MTQRRLRAIHLAAAVLLVWLAPVPAGAQDRPELRALWVDAFHEGIRSPREADDLVAAAKRAHLNTLIVQVRRRGDALYTKTVEPPLADPAYDPSFDALAYIVDAGHRAGLEVHAWINAMPVWRDEAPPADPRHVFNRHGPQAPGDQNWMTSSPSGDHKFPVGYFLDPGHPDAAAYLAEIYLNVVRNYAVDGIHFDYVRYPETEERLARGAGVGYNPVSVRRFQRATGRSGVPEPGDQTWIEWRRAQVSHLVRRVSIEAKAINPRIKISAALIPWGQPPTDEGDFEDAAPMQRIFQNWHRWLDDGLLDLGIPMNYATETDDRVRTWFDGWIRWQKRHQHGRQLAVGLGAYRNTPGHTLAQIARARTDEDGARVAGVSFFSYAVPAQPRVAGPGTDLPATPVQGSDRFAYLVEGVAGAAPAFTSPAAVPAMPWIESPDRGWIAGTTGLDGATVTITRRRFWPLGNTIRATADGNGYFGLAKVKPGTYEVSVQRGSGAQRFRVRVEAGKVSRVVLTPPGEARSGERTPTLVDGAVVRGPLGRRQIALMFTGHEFAEGGATILDVLKRRRMRASFFLTGVFLRDAGKAALVRRMISDGHYVGAHSDAHLLYAPWTGPRTTLISRDVFVEDLERNYDELARAGVPRQAAAYFLPPYEWYTREIAEWTRSLGLTLINFTPGTRSNADYTEEATPQFVPSATIFDSILARERDDPSGLDGFLLLLHLGAGPGRSDKFHLRFDELAGRLTDRGYDFVGVDTLLGDR